MQMRENQRTSTAVGVGKWLCKQGVTGSIPVRSTNFLSRSLLITSVENGHNGRTGKSARCPLCAQVARNQGDGKEHGRRKEAASAATVTGHSSVSQIQR